MATVIPLYPRAARTGSAPLVRCQGLTKRFRRTLALDAVALELRPGRVTAVVGPNAAGKSTLIKTLLGLVRPDAGTLEVLGESPARSITYRAQLGYMPQEAPFPANLTGREVLSLLLSLRTGSAWDDDLLQRFGLDRELDKPVRTLSGGTRQKLSAALAFLFRPRLLILDEPTAGLDPVACGILKDKIRLSREAGAGVLLTSHIMSDLEELADDIVLLIEGRVRFQGTLNDLAQRTGHQNLERAIASLMARTVA